MPVSRPVVCKFHGTDRRKSLNASGYGDRKVETNTFDYPGRRFDEIVSIYLYFSSRFAKVLHA